MDQNFFSKNSLYYINTFILYLSKVAAKNEASKLCLLLCPYVKSFGDCMNISKEDCIYRHRPHVQVDEIRALDEHFNVPREGYVTFEVAFIADTNHFFIHLLGYENSNRTHFIEYRNFLDFDEKLQSHFSKPDSIKSLTEIEESEIYAFRSKESLTFKRVIIKEITECENNIVYEMRVKAIDYGAIYRLPTNALVRLPSEFKRLPPQVHIFVII